MTHPQSFDFGARFATVDAAETVTSEAARHIEDRLQVCLPADFGRICEFLNGCGVDPDAEARGEEPTQQEVIVALTIGFRRDLGLPLPYVVLGADDEMVLLLACAGAAHGQDSVHLIPRNGLHQFSVGARPGHSRRWRTFVDYFAEALESNTDPIWR